MYILYFVTFEKYPNLTKIGITKNLDKRMSQLSRIHGNIIAGSWWSYLKRKECSIIEKRLHSLFHKYQINVEGNGGTEFFDTYKSFPPNLNINMYVNFFTVRESGYLYDYDKSK